MSETGSDQNRDEWRGWVSAKVESLVKSMDALSMKHDTLSAKMEEDHEAMKGLIAGQYKSINARIEPLEKLRVFLAGIGLACVVGIPVIWLYASRINELLARVDKLLPPGTPKP